MNPKILNIMAIVIIVALVLLMVSNIIQEVRRWNRYKSDSEADFYLEEMESLRAELDELKKIPEPAKG